MSTFDPEQLDLAELASVLERSLETRRVEADELDGRTLFRNVIVAHMRCSELEGEQLVETMTVCPEPLRVWACALRAGYC
jgi:hypothetical protein